MENVNDNYMFNQIYLVSVVSVITSVFFGIGLIFAIPCLVFTYHIKLNYISYNIERNEQSMFYSICGIVLSIVIMLLEYKLF